MDDDPAEELWGGAWDDLPDRPPIPEGCTCDYDLSRRICDAYYTTTLTRKDPDCPIHGVG